MLKLAGPGRVFTAKVQNQAQNVVMVALKPVPAEEALSGDGRVLRGRTICKAAQDTGNAVGFTFEAAAELVQLFRVQADSDYQGGFLEMRV